jgi:hypothetical protein
MQLLVLACLAVGCTGRTRHIFWDTGPGDGDGARDTASKPRDKGVKDGAAPDTSTPLDGGSCSPEDAVTTCNPLAPSKVCAAGAACYIVKGTYLDCICPPGTAAAGSSCNTATDCAPKLTCYSATGKPPGTCVQLCDPTLPACKSGETCKTLNNFPQLGYCD